MYFLQAAFLLRVVDTFLRGSSMLIISRKKDQKIILADDIEITILEVGRNRVRFGIKAPKHIPIHTRLKDTPAPEEITQVVEIDTRNSPLEGLPAAVGIAKRGGRVV
jgi:carbon storage regulator CsrA